MGQVWQATDTQLNRDVALKILPDAFAADPDWLSQFQREAQVLASLNPNIAAIYGIEEAEGTRALVVELVDGPTLADRIAQGGYGSLFRPAYREPFFAGCVAAFSMFRATSRIFPRSWFPS